MVNLRTVASRYSFVIASVFVWSCAERPQEVDINSLFTLMPDSHTNISFENRLLDESGFNVFKYRNYYNGGGVAVGDVNNDGLPDIYMVANQQPNKLFLNQGDFKFADITGKAGVAGSHNWSTGVCMADVNSDGWLDIYVSNSGNIKGDNRANELFLNEGRGAHGIPRFVETAAEYGIDNRGFSTHATFFDYDRDGDLDLYVLNNAFRALSTFDLPNNERNKRDPEGGDYLYRNDDGQFVDVSEQAGIYSSVIGFGLGLTVSDINNDGWQDIYVANDFFERDYLYMNEGDGSFTERLEEMISHTSLSSMGSDIADLNNDGLMDIFTTDMLPEDDYRLKTTFTFETFDFIEKKAEWGYYHQLAQNTLQLNRGIASDGLPRFSDVGLMAGVAATDWSWGTYIVDLDNDGMKDVFVTNGIFRDVTNQDYLDYLRDRGNIERIMRGEQVDIAGLIDRIPSTKLANYAYRNNGDLTFTNRAEEWGLSEPSFSNGAAFGDLDGDGDSDLVINNVNQNAFFYRNETDSLTENHYLKVRLEGTGANSLGVGSKVTIEYGENKTAVLEQMPMRVFQSSADYTLTFGLGRNETVRALTVDWPDRRRTVIEDITADQLVTVHQENAQTQTPKHKSNETPFFRQITGPPPLEYRHVENRFDDFRREPLLPHKLSTEGPQIEKGDVNGDGMEDIYLSGAKGSPGTLLLQQESGRFTKTNDELFRKDQASEDVAASLFDADQDGDLDLYVASGGNEYASRAPALRDRLYINDGNGAFTRSTSALPSLYESSSCVAPGDFDGDGDIDLFVGSRSVPWQYGETPKSHLLLNNGEGKFTETGQSYATNLNYAGMVTDALWLDYDGDKDLDLAVVGEWMRVSLYENTGEGLVDVTESAGLGKTEGWWNCIIGADMDSDGNMDLVVGNRGHNTKIQTSPSEPARLYISDFDNNGLTEQILCFYQAGRIHPSILRPVLVSQLPYLGGLLPTHADYAGKQIGDIFTEAQLSKAQSLQALTSATTIYYGSGSGTFHAEPLTEEVQFSPVHAIMAKDFDDDGLADLLLAGNFHGMAPQFGRHDASWGTLLRGVSGRKFIPVSIEKSGLALKGEIRDIIHVRSADGRESVLFAQNNGPVQLYEINAK